MSRTPVRDRERKRRETAAATGICWLCGNALHPVLVRNRYATHPNCDPDEISPFWRPGTWSVRP